MNFFHLINSLSATHFLMICGGVGVISCFVIVVLVKEKNRKEIEKQSMEQQVIQLQEEIARLNLDLSHTQLSKNNDVWKLKEKIKELKEELDNKEKKIEEESTQKDKAKNETSELKINVDKLRKDNDDLEEEIKDLADEIDKKTKKHREEIAQKNRDVESLQNEKQQLNIELETSASVVMAQGKELDLKNKSLRFVEKVLGADDVDDFDRQDLYKKVNSLVEYLRGDFSDSIKDLCGINDTSLLTDELDHWEQVIKKSWLSNKKSVAFVGEFSAGKTSIVNKILSKNNPNAVQLPTSTKATTAIPTYISEGKSKTPFQFFTPDNKLKVLSEEIFRSASKEILDQINGVSSLIKYFVMTCENLGLQGLSILDTPGFSSNDKDDAMHTIDVINECDALFWIVDVNVGTLNQTSLKTIKAKLHKPLYIIINKTDTKALSEVQKVQDLIQATLKKEGVKTEGIIQYSKQESIEIILDKLNKISYSNDTGQYLDSLKKNVNNALEEKKLLKDKKHEELVNLSIEVNKEHNSIQGLADEFESSLKEIDAKCDYVRCIPQYKHKIIGDDIFSMSYSEGVELKKTLDEISSELVKNAKIIFNNHKNAVKNFELKNTKLVKMKEEKQVMESHIEQLQKIIKQLNDKIAAVVERGGR